MYKKSKNRLPKIKAYLEVLALALTVLEKIKMLVMPLLLKAFISVKVKGIMKLLFTLIPVVINCILP